MGKKKEMIPEPLEVEAFPVGLAEPAPESLEAQQALPEWFRTGEWAGQLNYVCGLCGFASLDLAHVEHQARNCSRCGPVTQLPPLEEEEVNNAENSSIDSTA